MNTREELRAFVFGLIAGSLILIGTVFAVSYSAGIKWQPVQSNWR